MCDFLNPHQKEKTFQVLTPQQKTARALIWTKKLIFEDFYKKIFRLPSRFQIICET